jgi:polyhydroxyalkanoate synthesis regulator phasin
MDEPGSGLRDLAERALLAAVGAVALTAERADALADELAEKGGLRRDDARQLLEDARNRWRGDATRVSERAGEGLHGFFQQLGLATRDELEELELRVAQLEHRLRLLEGVPRALPAEPASKPAQPRRLDPR